MENENAIYETKECKEFVKKIANEDANLIKASTFLNEQYGISLEVTDGRDITLQPNDGCVNESQSLLDAKAYVAEHLDMDLYNNILFI